MCAGDGAVRFSINDNDCYEKKKFMKLKTRTIDCRSYKH